MASERPTKILLSKSDLSHEHIEKMTDKKAWELIYSIRTVRVRDNRLQVCFTGFGISRKQELANIARANNFKVVASVTKKLDFLCGGTNAGPKKREKLNHKEFSSWMKNNSYTWWKLVKRHDSIRYNVDPTCA